MMRRLLRRLRSLVCYFHNGHTFDPDEWSYQHGTDVLTFYCGVCGRPWWSTLLVDYPDVDLIREVLDAIEDEIGPFGEDDIVVQTDEGDDHAPPT